MGNNIFEVIRETLKKRKSQRIFLTDITVIEDNLFDMIEVCKYSPRAGGIDSTHIYPIKLNDELAKIFYRSSFYQDFILRANYAIIFSGDKRKLSIKYKEPFLEQFCCQNATLKAYGFMLLAESLCIPTCFVGGIRQDVLSETFFELLDKKIYGVVYI